MRRAFKILAIVGSRNDRTSNTRSIVDGFLDMVANEGLAFERRVISLGTHPVKECRGCWVCTRGKPCPIQDDSLQEIKAAMVACDMLVLANPVYTNQVSGQMKAFLDRLPGEDAGHLWSALLRLSCRHRIVHAEVLSPPGERTCPLPRSGAADRPNGRGRRPTQAEQLEPEDVPGDEAQDGRDARDELHPRPSDGRAARSFAVSGQADPQEAATSGNSSRDDREDDPQRHLRVRMVEGAGLAASQVLL